ncbi:unnamed protein product, partial [marine sediment metagenome]
PRILETSAQQETAPANSARTGSDAKSAQSASQGHETTQALIARLTSPLQDRALAAFRLGEQGDDATVRALINALKDKHWRVRDRAAEALYKLRDPRAVGALIKALDDPVWRVRFWAAKALGRLKAAEAVPRLIKAIYDEHPAVTEHAALTLADIKDPRGLVALTKALESAPASAGAGLSPRRRGVEVRNSAAGALGQWGGDEVVPALAKA